jgi:hypothetical protein
MDLDGVAGTIAEPELHDLDPDLGLSLACHDISDPVLNSDPLLGTDPVLGTVGAGI